MENGLKDKIENELLKDNKQLLSILLEDKTTKQNLIWATDNYRKYGQSYKRNGQISIDLITGYFKNIIKPRSQKSEEEHILRKKDKAEVFTPSWICNAQNNLIDNDWFGYIGSFNNEIPNGWQTSYKKVEFIKNNNKTWKDYVDENRLEVSCGEAPYLTSRYDSVSGEYIEVKDRIGFLDRKLRIISENVDNEIEWINWSIKAVKSIYGYDYQGDNVLLARQNLLYTIVEFYEDKFKKLLDIDDLIKYAKVIAWNVWQMDATKYVAPMSCTRKEIIEINYFGEFGQNVISTNCKGCLKNDIYLHNGKYCKIKDWKKNRVIRFIDLLGGE